MKNSNLTCGTVAERKRQIAARHAELKSWAKVAAEYPGVKRGTLQRFATSGYKPKDRGILAALGLLKPRKLPAHLSDWPVPVLARALRERQ